MRVLVLFAHPGLNHSKINLALANTAKQVKDVTFVDLYAQYPRMIIDVDREQKRLLDHDAILFQFPFMWYSTPPLLKEWQDLVLEYGFAYGEGGDKLAGKLWLTSVTAGAPKDTYSAKGHNKYNLRELLRPMEATANLCKMEFIAPYALFSALNTPDLESHSAGYRKLLEALRDDKLDMKKVRKLNLLTPTTIPKGN